MNEQLIKKDCVTGIYDNIYPITVIQAIKDNYSDKGLDEILNSINHIYLPFTDYSKTLTRIQVPNELRRKGLFITYESCKGTIITEFYNYDDFEDSAWGDDNNWTLYDIPDLTQALEEVTAIAKQVNEQQNELKESLSKATDEVNKTVEGLKSSVGASNGIAPLDENSKVPAAYLPSYVDDVLEYDTKADFPIIGETGKIYVALDDNLTYRWSGSTYIELSKSIGLGETASTAYPGNKGKKNEDDIAAHKDDTDNPHNVTKEQLGLDKVDNTADADKPISIAQQDALNDKVDKVEDKGLSTNDFTDNYKDKLDNAPSIRKLSSEEIEELTDMQLGDSVYDTTTNKYMYWNGSVWKIIVDEDTLQSNEDETMALIVKLHAIITATASPSTIYKGENTNVNINHSATFDGKALTYTPMVNGSALANPYSINDTTTFNVAFNINNADPKLNTTITRSVKVNAYYPRYYGRADKTTLVSDDVLTLEKQPVAASSIINDKTISSAIADYLWLCVPDGMTISEVSSSGFGVPMEVPITVEVSGKGNYKCYRSTNKVNAGSVTFNIK